MKPEWLNTRDLYVQYCYVETAPLSLVQLLEVFGSAFDDDYAYWFPKGSMFKRIIKRRPVWMIGTKRMPAEKYHG